MRVQLTLAALALVMSCATVEARGRRGGYAPYYYGNNGYNYNYTYNTIPATTPVVPTGTVVTTNAVPVTNSPTATVSTSDIVQVTANKPDTTVVTANSTTSAGEESGKATSGNPSTTSTTPVVEAPKPVMVGSAQWKAEQCARMNSVVHLGGGFGGGSHEGCGFGATADQAIRTSCFWGQLTPIEIGVARGANGYYAVVFYR